MFNLNKDQINQLYNLVGKNAPDSPTSEEITKILIEIEKRISPGCIQTQTDMDFASNINILLVDDLELSVHQLGKLLSNCGYNTTVARSVEEAVDFYKKQSFQYVVVDLFLPDPEDGLNLIDFINNSEKTKKDNTKIIVISGSDDGKLIRECFFKGANEFINKSPDWHKKLMHHIGNLETHKSGFVTEIETKVEDTEIKIASVTISNLNKNDIIETVKREIQILINTGYVNIILDLEKVKTLDSAGLNVIVFAYKACFEKKGILKLCGVNNAINDALSYVFLNNLIPVFKDIDNALFDFKKETSLNS